MKKETITEISFDLAEEIRKQELNFWRKQHPDTKVRYNKKRNEIIISYPLPKDFDINIKIL